MARGALRFDALTASLQSARACLLEAFVPIVFHEDYTEEDEAKLRAVVPTCEFYEVDFTVGDADYVRYQRRKGYMLMCRFWSGVVQAHSALQRFTHYMRLDDDSYFINPKVTAGELARMLDADYSYRQIFRDQSPEQESLYDFTADFLVREGLFVPPHRLLDGCGRYSGKAVYNNFHLASLRFWQQPLVRKYTDALEAERGCLRRGWLDANIHTMLLALVSPHTDLRLNQELHFGYRHNHHRALSGSLVVFSDPTLPFVVQPSEYK